MFKAVYPAKSCICNIKLRHCSFEGSIKNERKTYSFTQYYTNSTNDRKVLQHTYFHDIFSRVNIDLLKIIKLLTTIYKRKQNQITFSDNNKKVNTFFFIIYSHLIRFLSFNVEYILYILYHFQLNILLQSYILLQHLYRLSFVCQTYKIYFICHVPKR